MEEKWDDIVGEKVCLLFFPYVTGNVTQVDRAPNKEVFFDVGADHNDFLTVKLTKPVRFEGSEPEEVLILPRWIWRRMGQNRESKPSCPVCGSPVSERITPPPSPYVAIF